MAVLAIAWDLESLTQLGFLPQDFSTSGTHHNTAYADGGFSSPGNSTSAAFSPTLREQEIALSSASSDFWFHATMYLSNFGATDTGELLRFRSGSGGELRLRGVGSGSTSNDVNLRFEKTTNGTTWTQIGSNFLMRYAFLHQLDIRVKLHASTGDVKMYANGVLMFSFQGDTSGQTSTVTHIIFGGLTTSSLTSLPYWAEVVVADEPTFDWHVATLPVTGAGNHTQWTGTFADVDEAGINYADLITTNTTNNQQTFGVTNTQSGQTNNNTIKAVAVASKTAITTDATPSDVQHLLRSGGTTFATANLSVPKDSNYHSRVTLYLTDPNTAAAWTTGGVDAMEVGIKAV